MSPLSRLISLAAGTVRDATREQAIDAAADAGFGGVGLRFDIAQPSPAEITQLRARLDDTGLVSLDVEVVRLSPEWDESLEQRLVEWAHAVGARHLLVVSDDADRNRTLDGLIRVGERCRAAGIGAVLEFMRFTHPSTLASAIELAQAASPALAGVLVDPLHLSRSGGHPGDLPRYAAGLFPYAQLCDAPVQPEADTDDALITEARHGRLLPGEGALPLRSMIEALPTGIPLSVEVQSDGLERSHTPPERARRAFEATRSLLDSIEDT